MQSRGAVATGSAQALHFDRVATTSRSDTASISQHAANQDQRAQVVRIVICYQQRFAQKRLAGAMRNLCEEIVCRIRDEFLHLFQIISKLVNRFIPEIDRARFIRVRPITFRPFRRDVTCVAREFEYVPLRDPHVLEHLPGRVGKPLDSLTAFLNREIFGEILKTQVRITAAEQLEDLLA